MDKLKPIIEQKFWIFFALALIFPLVGWWPETNAKNAEIDKRVAAIDASFGTAEKDYSKTANKIWFDEISKVNKLEENRYNIARYYLWDKQRKLQIWPAKYITDRMEGVYSITPENEQKIDKDIAKFYRTIYHDEAMKLYNKLQPYKATLTKSKSKSNPGKLKEDGIIAVKGQERVFPIFNHAGWFKRPPSIATVWEAQEDLWLLNSIVEAINEMNAGASNISESTIKILADINFLGGKGRGSKQAKGKGKGKNKKRYRDDGTLIKKSENQKEQEKLKLMDQQEIRLQNKGKQLPLGYNPAEDFGVESGLEVISKTGRGGKSFNFSMGGGDRSGRGRSRSRTPQGLNINKKQFRTKAQGNFRYIDNDEKDPFKTRGFQIHLVMDHRKIPQFIEELSKSPWAIRIYRTHVGNSRDTDQFLELLPLSELTIDKSKKKKGAKQNKSFTIGSGGFGNREEDREDRTNRAVKETDKKSGYQLSLTNPYLAEVIISGKFTIYKEPDNIPEEVLNKENQVAEAAQPASSSNEEKSENPDNKESQPESKADDSNSGEKPNLQDKPEKTQETPENNSKNTKSSVTQLK
jgi:hypothetical protein